MRAILTISLLLSSLTAFAQTDNVELSQCEKLSVEAAIERFALVFPNEVVSRIQIVENDKHPLCYKSNKGLDYVVIVNGLGLCVTAKPASAEQSCTSAQVVDYVR